VDEHGVGDGIHSARSVRWAISVRGAKVLGYECWNQVECTNTNTRYTTISTFHMFCKAGMLRECSPICNGTLPRLFQMIQ
jgi:hypothetical protein